MPRKSLKVFMYFPAEKTDKPIAYTLVKEYDLIFNILHAEIQPNKLGKLTVVLEGTEENLMAALGFVESQGIHYNIFNKKIIWNEDVCVHCGACTGICPSSALTLNPVDWHLTFDAEKCLICEQCISTCPTKAIDINQFL